MGIFSLSLAIGVNLATYHFDRSADYQEFNPGIYAIIDDTFIAGAYFNSERKTSLHAGYAFRGIFSSPIDLQLGFVTGYSRGKILPMAIPSVKVYGVRFSLLLPMEKSGSAIHASFEF